MTPHAEAVPHVPQADSFQLGSTLGQLRRAIRTRWWLLLLSSAVSTALVALYLSVWPATWQAEVMVAVDAETDQQRAAFYTGWNTFRREGLNDEGTLMIAPPMLREVQEKLGLRYEDMWHPFSSYATHLWGESWLGRNYRKVKAFVLGTERQSYPPELLEYYKTLSDFAASVSVVQVGDSNIGLLVVKGSNPRVAETANTLVDTYLVRRRERYVAEARGAYESLKAETDRVRAELLALDLETRQFRARSGAALLFEKDRAEIGQYLALRAAVAELDAGISQNQSMLAVLSRQAAEEGSLLRSDRLFREDAAKSRLVLLEPMLANAREKYQAGAPEVVELERQVANAQAELAAGRSGPGVVRNSAHVSESFEQLTTRLAGIESTLSGLRAARQRKAEELDRLARLVDSIPEKQQISQDLDRRQRQLEGTYHSLNERLTQAAVSMASARSAPSAMRVVERAAVPTQPKAPNTKLVVAAGVLLGAFLGAVGALLLDLLNQRVHRSSLAGGPLPLFALVERDPRFVRGLYQLGGSRSTV
jgi:uncharacterized protein involved in exopolysaccharide biosynthesis